MGKYSPLRLGNNPENLLSFVAYPGYVVNSSCHIDLFCNAGIFVAIPEKDLLLMAHLYQRFLLGRIPSVAGGNGNLVGSVIGELMGDGRIIVIGLNEGIPANESLGDIHA